MALLDRCRVSSAATVELEVASVEPWMKYEFVPGTSVQIGTRRYVVVEFHEERGTLEVEEAK